MGFQWLESTKRERRNTVNKAFKACADLGYSYKESIETIAIECGVKDHTVERWSRGSTIPSGPHYEKLIDFARIHAPKSTRKSAPSHRIPTAAYKEEENPLTRVDKARAFCSINVDLEDVVNSLNEQELLKALKLILSRIN